MKFAFARNLTRVFALTLIAAVGLGTFCAPVIAQGASADSDSKTLKIEAVNFLTWWFHDATGYHPAILLRLENASGVDLSGVLVKFQARFTNLRTGYINVARVEKRIEYPPGKRQVILLRAPKAYELPIDQHLWPRIECKVMCRVGDVGDEETQDLLVTKLDSLTMSFDEAMTLLSKRNDIRIKKAPRIAKGGIRQWREEKALVASAGSLNGGADSAQRTKVTLTKYLSTNTLPGLGNDFYQFESKFGLPITTDTSVSTWTWASYSVEDLDLDIIVGSRGRTGKADLIVTRIPATSIKNDQQIISLIKAFGGVFRNESMSAPNRSVRYLPAGRIEFGMSQAQNFRAAFFPPNSRQDATYEVVLTRLPGNVLNILRNEVRNAKLLKFLAPVTGLADAQ